MNDPTVVLFCLGYVTAGVAMMAAVAGLVKPQRALQMSPALSARARMQGQTRR